MNKHLPVHEAAETDAVPKFIRLPRPTATQLETAAAVGGINQARIIQDALDLYFNPASAVPAAAAQRKALLTRMRLAPKKEDAV